VIGRRSRALARRAWARGREPLVTGRLAIAGEGATAVRRLRWRLAAPAR
jgi:hypothetical protein